MLLKMPSADLEPCIPGVCLEGESLCCRNVVLPSVLELGVQRQLLHVGPIVAGDSRGRVWHCKAGVWGMFCKEHALLLDADFQNLTGMQGGGRLIKTDERGESEG